MKRKITCTVAAVLVAATMGYTQQPLTPTQYGQLRTVVNPAASLMHLGGEVGTIGRRQWVGIEGAPSVLWGNGYMGFRNINATIGVNIRHESLAVEKLTEASAFFAKSVRISAYEYLGLSLNAGIVHHNGRFSQLDPHDPSFRTDIIETDGLVGFGVMLYRPDRYYVGLSLPRLMLSNLGVGSEKQYDFHNLYHLTAGALFALGNTFHVRPSLLVTHAEGLRPQAELSAMVFAKELFGIGLNVRSYGEVAAMMQLYFGGLGLGYSYQFNPRNEPMNQRIDNATHEIGLRYRFGGIIGLL